MSRYPRRYGRRGSRVRTATVLNVLLSAPIISVSLHLSGWLAFSLDLLPVVPLLLPFAIVGLMYALDPLVQVAEGKSIRVTVTVRGSSKRIAWQLAKFSVLGLTDLAVLLAGRRRPVLRDEWRAHLAGEGGHDPATWAKVRQAFGFVASAIQFRLADAADLAWRPVDAALGSRTLSNLFVWGPVAVVLAVIDRHDGRFGLVADIQDPVALGAFLFVVIRTGRWWRGVKLPEPKARRAKE